MSATVMQRVAATIVPGNTERDLGWYVLEHDVEPTDGDQSVGQGSVLIG